MNALSLRVSSIKGHENIKKNSEIRMEIVKLPRKYENVTGFGNQLELFAQTDSIEEQIKILRDISVIQSKDLILNKKIFQFLTDLFMEIPLKHAVRGTIIKIFRQNVHYEDMLIECFSNSLQDILDRRMGKILNDHETVCSLTGCLEIFAITKLAIHKQINSIFKTAIEIIQTNTKYLRSDDFSPAAKNELILLNHNSLRIVITCLQEYSMDIKHSCLLELGQLKIDCNFLVDNNDIPMDTKIVCGHILIIESKLTNTYDDMVENLIGKNIDHNHCKFLCYAFGIVVDLERGESIKKYTKIFVLKLAAEYLSLIAKENSVQQNMVLASCRGFLRLSKSILSYNINDFSVNEKDNLSELLKICLEHAWSHLDSFMDAVRHLCRDLLKNLVIFSLKYNSEYFFVIDQIFDYAMAVNTTKSVKCTLLCCLSSVIGTNIIINRFPEIIDQIIKLYDGNDTDACISNCYETLMVNNKDEISSLVWCNRWINPLIVEFNGENRKISSATIENLISKAVKGNKKVVFDLIQQADSIPDSVLLSILAMARKCGEFDNISSTSEKWKGILSLDKIKYAMVSSNDETRIAAIKLLAETHKTTEELTEYDLELILWFLQYNINTQSPSTRQQILSQMKIILIRTKTVTLLAHKNRNKKSFDDSMIFLNRLRRFCILNLFSGANLSRRTISFKVLLHVLEIYQDIVTIDAAIDLSWQINEMEMLFKCLDDTYESNKAMCIDVLKMCPKNLLFSEHINLTAVQKLATSVKPSDSITAAYYLEFLVMVAPNLNELKAVTETFFDECSKISTSSHYAVIWCEKLLNNGLEIGKISLLRMARENPLYGILLCIRHLLSKLDFKKLAKCQLWRNYFQRLIELCKNVTELVGPIVNSSSPEGHLPNDFSEVSNFLPDHDNEISFNGVPNKILAKSFNRGSNNKTTPQMVLLCAWRTVKEASLLLGHISLNSPLMYDSTSYGLITANELLDIGDHFKYLLAETKHRGAFEQAYTGFSKLCCRLWIARESELHNLPMKWLKELLNLISGANAPSDSSLKSEKICATRRSAGVPFMVQALITSELQVCSSKGLNYCMSGLLDLCHNGRIAEIRTHALNIVRALFRCTDLGDTIGEYVSEGIHCAIRGYSADNWPEKNSATLLFSALMVRVFGVQRTKNSDNLNIRNKMTGRIFFLRYPKLHDFFMIELEEAANAIVNNLNAPKLHAILLILSRLYPSSLEGTESNLNLKNFIPNIEICSESSDMMTRKLSAKAICSLLPTNLYKDFFMSALNKIVHPINSNKLHAILLQLLNLLKKMPETEIFIDSNIICDGYNQILKILIKLVNINIPFDNCVLAKVYMEILIEYLKRYQKLLIAKIELVHLSGILLWMNSFENILINNQIYQKSLLGRAVVSKSFIILSLFLMKFLNIERKIESMEEFILRILFSNTETDDAIETVLNLLFLMLSNKIINQDDDNDAFNIERYFIECLEQEEVIKLREAFMKNQEIRNILLLLTKVNYRNIECRLRAYALMIFYVEPHSDTDNNQMKNLNMLVIHEELTTKTTSYEAKVAYYKWFYSRMHTLKNLQDFDLSIMLEFCTTENPDDVRLTSGDILTSFVSLWRVPDLPHIKFIIDFSRIILLLLRDDDENVRIKASKTVYQLLGSDKKNADVFVELFAQRKYLIWLCEFIVNKRGNTFAFLTFLILLSTEEIDINGEEEDDIEYRVFDKNEANTFGEKRQTIFEIKTIMKELCEKDERDSVILKQKLLKLARDIVDDNCFKILVDYLIDFNFENITMVN